MENITILDTSKWEISKKMARENEKNYTCLSLKIL